MSVIPREAAAVRSLTVRGGSRVILDSVSISFPNRRTTCIVGPGGSGKSTLLHAIARNGALRPPLWVEGAAEASRPVALSPQQAETKASTLREVIADGRTERAVDSMVAAAWSAVPEARNELHAALDHRMEHVPPALRRVAEITPALAAAPDETILLDEPDTRSDHRTLSWTIGQLEHLRRHRSLVVVTHHLVLARRVADNIVFLLDGHVVEQGPADLFFTAPRTERAAAFILMGS